MKLLDLHKDLSIEPACQAEKVKEVLVPGLSDEDPYVRPVQIGFQDWNEIPRIACQLAYRMRHLYLQAQCPATVAAVLS